MMFDPRENTTPPVPDLVGIIAQRQRMNEPVLLACHAAVAMEEAEQIAERARLEAVKRRILWKLEQGQ